MKNNYILMLEGDDDDKKTTRAVFFEKGFSVSVTFIEYSHELFSYLDHCIVTGNLPGVILLSIRSVPDDGLTVLKKLKENTAFRHIPVIMLSELTSSEVVKTCYVAGAASVIQKPFSHEETLTKIEMFVRYWFEVVQLPESDEQEALTTH